MYCSNIENYDTYDADEKDETGIAVNIRPKNLLIFYHSISIKTIHHTELAYPGTHEHLRL